MLRQSDEVLERVTRYAAARGSPGCHKAFKLLVVDF
jgi:hypothetical protein